MKRPFEIGRAARLNTKLRLEQVSLFALEARHERGMAEPRLAFSTSFEPVRWTPASDGFAAVFPLSIDLEHAPSDDVGVARVTLARLHVATRVVYAKTTSFEPADRELLPDYFALNGWMHVWPYARADVHALSSRLGFPPLVLPVLLGGQTSGVEVSELVEPAPRRAARAPKAPRARSTEATPPAKAPRSTRATRGSREGP